MPDMIVILGLLLTITCPVNSKLVIDNRDIKTSTAHCLEYIVEKYRKPQDYTAIWGKSAIKLKSPVIILSDKMELELLSHQRATHYIVEVEDNLRDILEIIGEQSIFQANAYFIVLCKSITSNMFLYLSQRYIHNVIVILMEDEKDTIYTFDPYSNENLNFPNLAYFVIDECKNGELTKNNELFLDKIPTMWRNTTLNISLFDIPPFVNRANIDSRFNEGLEISLYKDIKEKLKFNISYTDRFKAWGSKSNGVYSHALGAIKNRTIHSGIGFFHLKMGGTQDFDVTLPILLDGPTWIVPKAQGKPFWKSMLHIVRYLWCPTLITLAASIAIWITACKVLHVRSYDPIMIGIELFGITLTQPPKSKSKHFTFKILLHCCYWFSLVFTTLFTSKMIVILAVQMDEYQIDTLEGIYERGYKFGLYPDSISYFENSTDVLEKKIMEDYIICDLGLSCLNKTAFNRDMATTRVRSTVAFLTPIYYLDDDGRPLLHITNSVIINIYAHWYFQKGFPIFDQINDLIWKLKGSGVLIKYYKLLIDKLIIEYSSAVTGRKLKSGTSYESGSMRQMRFIFYSLMGCHIISLLVFIMEVCLRRK